MPQVLKDDVQAGIAAAATRVFAQRGYAAATMAEVAAAAGVSTGNVYRYFESKHVLFDDVVSVRFARTFAGLVRRRVRALDGVTDVRALEPSHLYHLASEELLRFCIEHRLRVVILLGRAAGSRHAGFAERMVQDLIALAIAHFRALEPRREVTRARRFALLQIYRNFVGTMVTVLAGFTDPGTIRALVGDYSRYHLAGVQELFAGDGAPKRQRR